MTKAESSPNAGRRSARWICKDDLPEFVHRSTLAAAGWSRENLMERGCDFDFLRGAEEDTLPEGLFDGWVGGW